MRRFTGEIRQDFWYSARMAGRNPGFSTVAVLTLAVAIGGSTTVFSLVNALAIKPLPVRAPQEIVRVYPGESQMSWPNYADLRERTAVLSDLAAHGVAMRALSDLDVPVRVMGETASTNYLTFTGVPPLLGRTFTVGDKRPDILV